MALSGWDSNKKLVLTIDNSNVDEDLTDFPVLVTISSGTGQTNFDTTRVFDELDGGIDNTTKLMLHMDDTALSDSSPSSHSITKNGDAVRSATQSKFGGYSVYFAGTGDYLSLVDSDDWDFGLGDFTIDWWMRRVTTFGSGKDMFNCNFPTNPNWLVYFYSGTLYFFNDGANIYSVSYSEVLDVWEHYAIVRSGDNMYYFVDGVQIGSTGTGHAARSINGANFLKIGGGRGGAADSNCYMDEVRISKGIARWTSNFTPPTNAYTDDRRKIAITDSNDNQLYTEIEKWDFVNEEANLWVKVPTIASGTDTALSLYYDSTHDDNIHFVGGVGDLSYQMVVDLGDEGTYDTVDVKMPSVIKESDTSYKMWYTGTNPTGRILYAVSENGTTWSGHQMVLDYNQIAYDTTHAYTPCVIKESDSSYKMWYSGNSGNVRILYSTSTDGITWATPQLVVDIGNISHDSTHAYYPSVIKESASSYKMWYSGHDGSNWSGLYATSTNGTTWSNHQLVVDINEEGTYDTNNVLGSTVIKDSDTSYKMWYGGDDGSNWRMLYATSTNGTTWSNNQLSLNINQEGTYDTTFAYYQSVIKDGLDYKMWYSGYDGTNYRILYSPYWSTNVWDGNFMGVWHMNQDPSGGTDAIKDSTPHVNHGTSDGTMLTEDLVDGKVGKGIDFDGGDDYINCGTGISLDDITNITIESTVELGSWGETGYGRIIAKSNTGNTNGWQVFVTTPNGLAFTADYATADAIWYASSTMSLDTWAHVAVQHTRGSGAKVDGKIYVDGTSRTITGGTDGVGAVQSDAAEELWIASRKDLNREFDGIIDEVRVSDVHRSAAWLKATYYSNWNNFVTFGEFVTVLFTFSNPIPVDLSTVYGITQQLYLTTTVTGTAPSYIYDATFYDAYDSSVINSTVSGVQSGQSAGVIMSTISGINYQWYVTATSSGIEDTSNTYTFTNKFLCEGQVQVSATPASGIPVRLYRRDTGEYIGTDTSAGVSGTFQIETDYNEYHYAIALYNATTTNALIADWLIPQE